MRINFAWNAEAKIPHVPLVSFDQELFDDMQGSIEEYLVKFQDKIDGINVRENSALGELIIAKAVSERLNAYKSLVRCYEQIGNNNRSDSVTGVYTTTITQEQDRKSK